MNCHYDSPHLYWPSSPPSLPLFLCRLTFLFFSLFFASLFLFCCHFLRTFCAFLQSKSLYIYCLWTRKSKTRKITRNETKGLDICFTYSWSSSEKKILWNQNKTVSFVFFPSLFSDRDLSRFLSLFPCLFYFLYIYIYSAVSLFLSLISPLFILHPHAPHGSFWFCQFLRIFYFILYNYSLSTYTPLAFTQLYIHSHFIVGILLSFYSLFHIYSHLFIYLLLPFEDHWLLYGS